MPRIARVVVPGFPHHITQRGNRRQPAFFNEQDKAMYIEIFSIHSKKAGVQVWAYCLMNNHVHFVAVPERQTSFAEGFGNTHKKYSRAINFREGWRGYLWQGRFFSVPLSEHYLYAAVRYVERNPVRAGLVQKAEDYRWSSARAHVLKAGDPILSDCHLTTEIDDWSAFLAVDDVKNREMIIRHTSTGRPLGDDLFLAQVEMITGRKLTKEKAGPKLRHAL